MKKQPLLLVTCLLSLISCASVKDPGECRTGDPPISLTTAATTHLVIFKETATDFSGFAKLAGVEFLPHLKMAIVDSSDETLLANIAHDERVETIVGDQTFYLNAQQKTSETVMSVDDELEASWGVDRINAPQVWAQGFIGQNVKVVIIDSGILPDITDFLGKIVAGHNFIGPDENDWKDKTGHGSTVAAIVSATSNGEFTRGVAPGVRLYIARVLDKNNWTADSLMVRALEWSLAQGVRVANISIGEFASTVALETAIKRAYAQGLFIVSSAGNEGNPSCHGSNVGAPANMTNVLAVSATNHDDGNTLAPFSSHGKEVSLAAPGNGLGEISKTDPITYGSNGGGTSYASPHVTGVAALLLSYNPMLTNEQLYDALIKGAKDLGIQGRDNYYGFGLVDAYGSLIYLQNTY